MLELRPHDVPALVWLGRLYLDGGQPELAEPIFARAYAQAPRTVAVLAGLGQAALARRDYAAAAGHFEQALALDPDAVSLHSPLAAAYRGLGRLDDAQAQLKLWRNTEVLMADPLRQELDLLLQSGLSYELRGVRAMTGGDTRTAVELFRQGIALTRENTALRRSLHHKLGTALFLSGDPRAALEQFETVLKMAPGSGVDESTAKAHYSLGVFMASSGKGREAIEHLSSAVRYQPNYVEARLALGDALRRSGRFEASLGEYAEAVRLNPRISEARFGYAIALVRLGRYRDARDWLTEAVRLQPDRPEFAHALARVLAAAPDDSVRDGARAASIVDELLKREKTTELGATMAMTLAEMGQFEDAAAVQRGVIEATRRAGFHDAARRLTEDLRLYERGRPLRQPWKDDDPVHAPGPPVSEELARVAEQY